MIDVTTRYIYSPSAAMLSIIAGAAVQEPEQRHVP